jgi:hypothetical protein
VLATHTSWRRGAPAAPPPPAAPEAAGGVPPAPPPAAAASAKGGSSASSTAISATLSCRNEDIRSQRQHGGGQNRPKMRWSFSEPAPRPHTAGQSPVPQPSAASQHGPSWLPPTLSRRLRAAFFWSAGKASARDSAALLNSTCKGRQEGVVGQREQREMRWLLRQGLHGWTRRQAASCRQGQPANTVHGQNEQHALTPSLSTPTN